MLSLQFLVPKSVLGGRSTENDAFIEIRVCPVAIAGLSIRADGGFCSISVWRWVNRFSPAISQRLEVRRAGFTSILIQLERRIILVCNETVLSRSLMLLN